MDTGITIEDDDDPLIGVLIDDRYEVIEVRGAGGMGTVYKAYEAAMDRDIALKVLHGQLRTSSEQVKRFEREIKATAKLRHPNTISVYGAGKTPTGQLYYVMQLLEDGHTLRHVLDAETTLPVSRVVRIMTQVAASLGEAHAAGIVHRDLKPDNIMVTTALGQKDFVTVLDFGLAKLVDPSDNLRITADGALFGTPAYMAPEQGAAQEGTARCDVYSMGCIAFELLNGTPPYMAPSPFAVLMKHMNEPPPEWTPEQKNRIPEDLRYLIDEMLAKDPENRPFDGTDVHDILEGIALSLPAPEPSPPRLRASSSRRFKQQSGQAEAGLADAPDLRASSSLRAPRETPERAGAHESQGAEQPRSGNRVRLSSRRAANNLNRASPAAPGSERSSDTINIPPMFGREPANGVLVVSGEQAERAVSCSRVGMRRIELALDEGGGDLRTVLQVRVGAPMSPVDEGVVWLDGSIDHYTPPSANRGAVIQVKLSSASISPGYRHMVQYWSKKRIR